MLLLKKADASHYRSVRQIGINKCPNPNNNACLFVICENSGKCFEDPTTIDCFKCQCTPDFTGKTCETPLPISPIECNPACQNGICIGSSCKCNRGYTGTYCEIRDLCSFSPCGIHGTCMRINLPDGPMAYCNCEDRWTGKYCDVNIDENCPIRYCFSGGTCEMNINVPYCVCPAMYTGERCEFLVGALTTIMTTVSECPLNCAPGRCIFSGNAQKPYACLWNGVMRPSHGTTG
ncbi:unnamed protein product [Rotaria sp. Silwood2]|nr:unnamed protein product [Rotaria sp. Silwood2]